MSPFRHLLLCLLWAGMLLAASSTGAAAATQGPWAPFAHVSFRHHTDDALQSSTALAQDRHGYLWVGTQNGLVRWDGFRNAA